LRRRSSPYDFAIASLPQSLAAIHYTPTLKLL
jgi:hypothetical protein